VVKARHSLSWLRNSPGREKDLIPELHLERFSDACGNNGDTLRNPWLIERDITGTTSANWNAERKAHR
jgi:hypothetical protein